MFSYENTTLCKLFCAYVIIFSTHLVGVDGEISKDHFSSLLDIPSEASYQILELTHTLKCEGINSCDGVPENWDFTKDNIRKASPGTHTLKGKVQVVIMT